MTDRDRLGREQVESAYLLKQLLQKGVRVFEVAGEGREITLSSPTDKIIMAVQGYAAEVEREQARVRTRAALEHRARAGRSTGGRVFGYTPARTPDGHATRAIVEPEAAAVRRVFALAADGLGVRRIAATLNAEGAPAPRKAGGSAGWAPSTVRTVLGNALYRGEATWGQTRKRDIWGQRRPSRRDAAEVVRVAVPDLRIVPEDLWEQAHARRAAGRALYQARLGAGLRPAGRPPSGTASRYLLSGLGGCAGCGGSMLVLARGAHRTRWACMTRHLRGAAACGNDLAVRLADADAAVLTAVEQQVLRTELVEEALWQIVARLQAPDEDRAAQGLRAELAQLAAEVARLADAIARGGDVPALLGALQDRERRRAHLQAALADHERQRRAPKDPGPVLAVLNAALADWRGMLRRETPAARTALHALLAGRLVFTPGELDGQRVYTFAGAGTVVPVIEGAVLAGSKGSGPRTRTIPPALRRALQHRDRACRFPGCHIRVAEGHHVRHWAQGGPTTLSNLALLCRRHHRAVHEEGYQLERMPDGALQFRRPNGWLLPDVPAPAAVPADPVGALRAQHAAEGLRLHARSGLPQWLGERLDVGWAIGVLHPLATRTVR